MDYEKMWNELKGLLERTEKMAELVKTSGVLSIISEIETLNTQYEDLPF